MSVSITGDIGTNQMSVQANVPPLQGAGMCLQAALVLIAKAASEQSMLVGSNQNPPNGNRNQISETRETLDIAEQILVRLDVIGKTLSGNYETTVKEVLQEKLSQYHRGSL